MVWHSPDWATVEQSTHWARLVGSGPTVQLRRIQRFGCTEYLLELSSQMLAVLDQTSADIILISKLFEPGDRPRGWSVYSPPIGAKRLWRINRWVKVSFFLGLETPIWVHTVAWKGSSSSSGRAMRKDFNRTIDSRRQVLRS